METLVLLFRGEALRTFELGERGLEVGSGPGCDIVVHDAALPERLLLVARRGGEVVVFTHGAEAGRARPRVLSPGAPLPLGARYALARAQDAPLRGAGRDGRTEPIALRVEDDPAALSLVVGRGPEARRVRLGARPCTIGSAPDCDLVLVDRAVSAQHCRLEPGDTEARVRDLGSRNGTYVDGVRAFVASITPGTRLRIGRTELLAVAGAAPWESRSDGLVAASPSMIELLGRVERHARLPFPVLIVGETGSGKEGIARALHDRGPRRDKPFVAVNAGAVSRDLVESELFGHERGAFTGALGIRRGVFEQADGGTLFLDEVGELPADLQARLLRVLETGEVRRVGAERSVTVDVRLVTATHRDLRAMTAGGGFRKDLYYRVAQLILEVPPLRARPEDVRALTLHFVARLQHAVGTCALAEAAFRPLLAHRWPGNVRELRNVLHAAAAGASGFIDVADIEAAIAQLSGPGADLETRRERSEDAVGRHGGNVTATARALGIPRSTLRDRLRKGE